MIQFLAPLALAIGVLTPIQNSAAPTKGAAAPAARFPLDAKQALELFPLLRNQDPGAEDEFDPALWFRHKAGLDVAKTHAEILGGSWRLRTNSLGLRMDRELLPESPAVSLLLTGDANMEGVCSNEETISARVEKLLGSLHPAESVEAINAGKGSYSFYHYSLVLDRFAARKPKMFVVLACLNDFEECLGPYHHISRTPGPKLEPGVGEAYMEAGKRWPDALAQGLGTLWYFKQNPKELDTALAVATALFGDMAGQAAALDTEFVVLWCPPFFGGDADKTLKEFAEPCAKLGLARADVALVDSITARFLESLHSLRITVVDLRRSFAEKHEPMFWTSDRHLNTAANALIADEITSQYEAMAGRKTAAKSR